MPKNTKLSSSVTVKQYLELVSNCDRKAIANFLQERFDERYIVPFSDKTIKHGFSMMAVSCLLVECLESFRQGWPNSNNKSALAFCYFFDRSQYFLELRGFHQEFYRHVRCGLLHQAETTGGWKITRKGCAVFEPHTKTLNAALFMKRLGFEITEYASELKQTEWDSVLWKNTRNKLKHICKQCGAQQ